MEYYNLIGLITKNDPTTENGGTFLCHDVVLNDMCFEKGKISALEYNQIKSRQSFIFNNKMFYSTPNGLPVQNGLYMRSIHHISRTVSHDELTSFFCTSYLLETEHAKYIWNYMLRNFGVYSFEGGKRYLPFQPAAYYPWARLASSKLTLFFLPFYVLAMLISINKSKEKTSSKLLYLDELYCMQKKGSVIDKYLWKLYLKKMTKMYGEDYIKPLTDIYFSSETEDFPIKEKVRKLYS